MINSVIVFTKKYKWHFVFWLCHLWYGYLIDKINNPQTHILSAIIFKITHSIYLFYSYLFLIRYVAKTKPKVPVIIGLFLLNIGIFIAIRYTVRFYIIPALHIPEPASMNLKIHLTNGLLWISNMFLYAIGYFYITRAIQKEKERREAVEHQLLAEHALHAKEQERLQLENIALRAQINPHFLYNTLGFLYAKALPYSDELSEGIMRLSEIMQYSIKPQDASGLVLLEDEIEHVENVLEINKLRFGQAIYINFSYEVQRSGVKIVPLILLTLVENVLKHGQLNEAEYPATIHLELKGDQLTFTTHNKKRTGPKERSTSIGLNNTHKRLEAVYGNTYSLTSKDENDHFTVTLIIELTNKRMSVSESQLY